MIQEERLGAVAGRLERNRRLIRHGHLFLLFHHLWVGGINRDCKTELGLAL